MAMNGKCNCGRPNRYSHFVEGNPDAMSCNKYSMCPTYDQLLEAKDRFQKSSDRYQLALQKIVKVNAMDYEYKTWAKEALTKGK